MQKQKNIPQGYKLTEVGVIPEDWDIKTYGEIFLFLSTATNSRDDLASSGALGYIHYGDIHVKWNHLLDIRKSTIPYLKSFIKTSAILIKDGDIIMADASEDYSGIGKSIEIIGIENKTLVAGLHTFLLRDTGSNFVSGFKAYLHVIPVVKNAFIKLATGLKVYGLSKNSLKNISIPVPPKKEQTTIANALANIDTLIQSIKKLINKKQAIKTATMQQLLTGKKRLPEFAYRADGTPKGTKQSELGEIPEDWVVKNIGSFTNCTAGGTPNTKVSSYWGGTHPWMSSGELHLKQVFDVAERITDEGLENSSTKYVPQGSVLIGLAGQGKTRGTVAISRIGLCTNQSIAAIYPSKNHISEYLYYNLDSRYEELRSLSTGDGGRGGLNLKIIKNIILPMPSVNEQTAIVTILSDMDKEIETLQTRLHKTEHIKQGMMQELLTGKTRLVTPA